ncbi:MAG TPA: ribonuclease Y [Candidatus Acidoferrum sp.]|nr:ribonuclease Y [Candidatus Acidoferrum sp.]
MIFFAVTDIYLVGGIALLAGALVAFLALRWKEQTIAGGRLEQSSKTLANAHVESDAIVREAKLRANEEALKVREESEKPIAARLKQLTEAEACLAEREGLVNRQLENLVAQEKSFRSQSDELQKHSTLVEARQQELLKLTQEVREKLAATARLSEAEARAQLMHDVEQQAQADAGAVSRHIIEEAKVRAEEKAKWIVSTAIQRYAGSTTFESTSATLALPDNEIKGRIIGREGRNIRAFEGATGVTVLIDDTPNAVVLSGFDPVRREIAREAMARLIADGRIHPTRIEEVVNAVRGEMEETVFKSGEEAVVRAGVAPMHADLVKLLGRLKFRHSYSQNVLEHSIEVSHLMALMAGELGLDLMTAKRAGLLHDIGKAVNHEIEGPHAIVGAEIVKRCGESESVVNGVAAHHGEVPSVGPWGPLVSAADAISASRPGARSETMTTYIKRVEDLERIGMSFEGVEKVYAVQAGRELRVLVHPEHLNDEHAFELARKITRKIEDELHYPGQIRVTVIRETRCVEFAK